MQRRITIALGCATAVVYAGLIAANPITPKRDATGRVSEILKHMPPSDAALKAQWTKQNDECQGGTDPAAIGMACPKRDALEVALNKRGQCWAYSDDQVTRADYRWHDCKVSSPPGFTPAIVVADQTQVRSNDDWYQEKYRPKSTALASYERVADQIDTRIGLANAALTCGLISEGQYSAAVSGLEEYRNSPAVMRLRMRLSSDDQGASGRYDRVVVDGVVRMNIGDARSIRDEGCRGLADRAVQNPSLLP